MSPALHIDRRTGEHLHCSAELDARQPYLNDHRPGGRPLFGTAMGIDVMARAARRLMPEASLSCISEVQIGEACVIDEEPSPLRQIEIDVRLDQADAQHSSSICTVSSAAASGGIVRHFAARVHFSRIRPTSMQGKDAPAKFNPPWVTESQVYGLFFHGPFFQVIDTACLLKNELVARSRLPTMNTADPRIVEFCLQSAGLLELADTGRMMIPHAIRYIELFDIASGSPADSLVASARRTRDSGSPAAAIDVEAFDAAGRLRLRITAYETRPLPFPAEETSVARLRDTLRATMK